MLPTTATHYLTNCTRARGFPGSVRIGIATCPVRNVISRSLFPSRISQPRRSMRFTTPSIASAGESVFAFENYSFPKPDVPSLLLFSSPASALRFHLFEWLSKLLGFNPSASRDPFRFCHSLRRDSFESGCSAERRVEIDLPEAPVKETQARQSETRFPRCVLELSRFFRAIGFTADHPKKRVPFHSPQFSKRLLSKLPSQISHESWTQDFSPEFATPS